VGDKVEIDFKRYARVEKIPGGSLEDSGVLRGCMINKDVIIPTMKRRIENPRIILLDCSLEFKKGESQTNVEITKEEDFMRLLELEEQYIKNLCADIIKLKPDVVCVEKGVSDLASHFLSKAGISVLRRMKKTDNNRLARASGAVVQHRTDELTEEVVGTGCGLFEVRKINDEYFSFFEDCKSPKACTLILRGATKDVLNEVERNLLDAMNVARNIVQDPRLVPGCGATEMAIAHSVQLHSKSIEGPEQLAFRAVGLACEVIPRTIAQNSGGHTVRLITELRSRHAAGERTFGIDGNTGKIADMNELGIWEPMMVKAQTLKTAVEASCMLLRIDDIVSGMPRKPDSRGQKAGQPAQMSQEEQDERMAQQQQ